MADQELGSDPNPRSGTGVFAALIVVLSLAGALLLYREALGLPLFFDDMVHLRWLEWHSLPEVWTTAEGLGYYRPLTMSVWKAEELLLGGHGAQKLGLGVDRSGRRP